MELTTTVRGKPKLCLDGYACIVDKTGRLRSVSATSGAEAAWYQTIQEGQANQNVCRTRDHAPDSRTVEVDQCTAHLVSLQCALRLLFHSSQNVCRRVQKLGLETLHGSDANFSASVRQLCAFAVLPPHRIPRVRQLAQDISCPAKKLLSHRGSTS